MSLLAYISKYKLVRHYIQFTAKQHHDNGAPVIGRYKITSYTESEDSAGAERSMSDIISLSAAGQHFRHDLLHSRSFPCGTICGIRKKT